jgi:hypothetical protein
MSLLMDTTPPAPPVPVLDRAAGPGQAEDDPFAFTIGYSGREDEIALGDISLCCSTTCSCSSSRKKQQ